MEWPVKLEIAEVPHLTLIQILSPLLPGFTIAIGLFLSDSPWFFRSWNAPIGYKTKLWLVSIFAYAIGLTVTSITDTATLLLMYLVRGKAQAPPWHNTYWKKTVKEYLGEKLTPCGDTIRLEDVDALPQYVGLLNRNKRTGFGLVATREANQQLQRRIAETRASLLKPQGTSAAQLQEIAAKLDEVQASALSSEQTINKVEVSARNQALELEWLTVFMALMQNSKVPPPAGAQNFIASAIQAAAVSAICLISLHWNRWPLSALCVSVAAFVTASYLQFYLFVYNGQANALASTQLAAMISELRPASRDAVVAEQKNSE
jgi:hypothetical protein